MTYSEIIDLINVCKGILSLGCKGNNGDIEIDAAMELIQQAFDSQSE